MESQERGYLRDTGGMTMTHEEKDLLLKDLCARLPYRVILNVTLKDKYDEIVNRNIELTDDNLTYITRDSHWIMYKPYLRPMSSMTKEERKKYAKLLFADLGGVYEDYYKALDYLHSIHVDYRGLIEKGLAISTEEFNPYKKERN